MRKVFMPDPMSRDNRRPLRNIVCRCPGCNWHVRDIELRAPHCYLCDKDTVPIESEALHPVEQIPTKVSQTPQ